MMDNINSLIKSSSSSSNDCTSSSHPDATTTNNTSPFTTTVNNLKDSDVVQIWDEVSSYIEKLMCQSKGVCMPGFGTFSFVQKKIDVGNNKFVLIQRPVFAISEKFAQTHALSYTKYPVTGSIPVHPLNYSAISSETAFSRDSIESCVRHVLQVFNRSVQSKKNIEFTFTGIGKLQIRNSKVKMKFFKDFVNSYDSTGKTVQQMQNRPHTADSVMSRNEMLHRPMSKNTCVLPRINSRAGAQSPLPAENGGAGTFMDTIREESCEESAEAAAEAVAAELRSLTVPVASIYSTEEDEEANNLNNNNNQVNMIDSDALKNLTTSVQSSANFEQQQQTTTTTTNNHNKYHIPDALPMKHHQVTFDQNYSTNASELQRTKSALSRPSSKSLIGSLAASGGKYILQQPPQPPAPGSACGHHNAGQELCYLCHQRCRRNVPVYLHEETKRKEDEETQLLMQYQQMKDLEKQLSDDEKRNMQRLDRAKVDAFNLGVAEAIKAKNKERPKTSDLSRSFIFRKRVRTPPKFYKQKDLGEYLSYQIDEKKRETQNTRQEIGFLEKLEQKQLAEDLAAQREQYLKEKMKRQQDLKSALDYQVKTKPSGIPKALPDTEVFGEHDAKNEKLAEQKRRELAAFNYHKEIIEQRKRDELLRQAREQEIDAENIERVKEEYRIDRANRYKRMLEMRKTLERDWIDANAEKKARDKDELAFRKAHAGELVHEQCDKYKRCAQCKRDLKNCGESNVWTDTRYLPGTRLII